jgi:hypothetical protein
MRIHNVHSRDLDAPAERVGPLIDGLGSADDRLWPADRWPTTPFELEGPLAVGTPARHGSIREVVEEYEPGWRLAFQFAPGLGLVGTHGVEVLSLGAERSRITYTLDCRVEPKLLPLFPILRRAHDALIEDLFDRAELAATGRVLHPARWPVSVRVANALELHAIRGVEKLRSGRRGAERVAPASGVAVPAALAALAALHAAWALGWHWPGGDERAFAERVIGHGVTEAPPAAATWAVAVALLAGAGVVRAVATGSESRLLRRATWGVAGVLLARGAVFIPLDLIGGLDEIYDRLDLAIYSPLCLALGAGAAAVAMDGTAQGRGAGGRDGRNRTASAAATAASSATMPSPQASVVRSATNPINGGPARKPV